MQDGDYRLKLHKKAEPFDPAFSFHSKNHGFSNPVSWVYF